MLRTSHLLQLIVISSVVAGLGSTALAQSHGLAKERFLQPEKSTKSMQPNALGLAGNSHQLDKNAANAVGFRGDNKEKSLALQNSLEQKSAKSGVGQLQLLKNNVTVQRHVGEEFWSTAFDGIQVKQKPSKGLLPTGGSLLQSRSSTKEFSNKKRSHGLASETFSKLKKSAEGLK